MRRLVVLTVLIFVLIVSSEGFCLDEKAEVGKVSGIEITKDVMKATAKSPFGNYLNYKVIGACFWIRWHWYGPTISSTLKVDHFVPGTVVSVFRGYTKQGQNAWSDMDKHGPIYPDKVFKKAGELEIKGSKWLKKYGSFGDGQTSWGNGNSSSNHDGMEKFKEVDVMGDPGLVPFYLLGFAMISPDIWPYRYVYSSLQDPIAWRFPTIDMITHPIDTFNPFGRVVGGKIINWGGVYPRTGFIDQAGDFKAGFVDAVRAADIATSGYGRSIHPLPSGVGACGSHCDVWPTNTDSNNRIENDFQNIKFQEIYPNVQTEAKSTFTDKDVVSFGGTYGQDQAKKGGGNYVWVMWRRHKGCIQGDGKYLWSFG